MYFVAMLSVFSADLPWISELFCGKRRGKCMNILDRAAPVWSPNGGRRFHTKEPERRGKAVGKLIPLPNQV